MGSSILGSVEVLREGYGFVNRWPSARPDDVVTLDDYNNINPPSVKPEDLAAALDVREQWTRGMSENYDNPGES